MIVGTCKPSSAGAPCACWAAPPVWLHSRRRLWHQRPEAQDGRCGWEELRQFGGVRMVKAARLFITTVIVIITSSTAQGGGGSFKNRKPIGEIGCCESGMAERSHWLTERWLELCLLEWLQWLQWSPHPQLLDVVWCTATVVVVVA